MKKPFLIKLLFPLLLLAQPAAACITCNKKIQEAIWDSTFYPNLLAMLSPFIVLGGLVAVLARISRDRVKTPTSDGDQRLVLNPIPLLTAALVLGIGLGGFADGIVLHQILQWHEMLSNKLPPADLVTKSVNMFWDGVFHFFCLLVVLTGAVMLWKAGRRPQANLSGKLLGGGLLAGWGIFNIIEGILDHHVLKLHNVREITGNIAAWNWGFLGFSVLLLLAGWALVRKGLDRG
jgi:uncharacterized membrane protein